MSTENSSKRLVSKGRYAWLITERTTLAIGAVVFLCLGLTTLFGAVIFLMTAFNRNLPIGPSIFLGVGLSLTCVSAYMFFSAFRFYKNEKKIERAAPITRHTSHLLPPEESLVRASAIPASRQQSELLRAAQHGKETPAEELLRATTNGQDI